MFPLLITPAQLRELMASEAPPMIFDASYDLVDHEEGLWRYEEEGHIPGARHVSLDQALTAKPDQARVCGGRHPLPTREAFAETLGQWGLTPDTQVVIYDRNQQNYAGRLWWMLKWCGHAPVALLDGGWQGWVAAGGASSLEPPPVPAATRYPLSDPLVPMVTVEEVLQGLHGPQSVIDSRVPPRYRGEVEPLDPVAGHIPGAVNRPFAQNLDEQGFFKRPELLRQEFELLLSPWDPHRVVVHCGSGVSALPNVIGMVLAGYPIPALFAGSWSEWCSDPTRPVELGFSSRNTQK